MVRNIQGIIVWILLLGLVACSSNPTEIRGHVTGGKDKLLTLERLDVNRTSLVDSVRVKKDDSFSFRTRLEDPELFVIKSQEGRIINLLLSPGEKVRIHTSHDSFGSAYQVNGSAESEGIRMLVEHLDRTRMELDSLQNAADSLNAPDSLQLELIRSAYAQTIIKQKRFTIKYLVEHMTSLSSVYALYQKYNEENLILGSENDLQYFKTLADSLELAYPNSTLTQSLRADIRQKEARFNNAIQVNKLLEMADGKEAGMLDLSIPDRDGKEISLSALKGKVILVCFWASGSDASIQTLLQFKSTYKKYHDRDFEIYAISLDNNKISWMNAMDFNEFEWINVSELSFPESKASLYYNVTSIPSTFLINRDGDIVAKNLYGRNLETWLDNLI
ncbi:MAG: TlpA disulfide reductase family protein [Bacteroidota bacterium]